MRAVVVERPGVFGVHEVPAPRVGAGQVVVEVRACGVCGTDVHIAHGLFPPTPYPIVPGHEFAGVVVDVGDGVTDHAVGERVAVDPTLACGSCDRCRDGRLNLCANWGAIGDTVNGALAERVVVPARNCYSLPAVVTWSQAALIEPLSCAVWAIRRVPSQVGDSALVLGGGAMGLLLAQLLSRSGARIVAVVEPKAERRALALEVGASAALDPRDSDGLTALGRDGFDLVADATGLPAVIQDGLAQVRRGGTFLVFGVAPATAEIRVRPFDVYNGDMTIVGSMAVNQTYGAAVRLASTLDLSALVAPTKGLEAYPEAIEQFGRAGRPKQQLAPTVD